MTAGERSFTPDWSWLVWDDQGGRNLFQIFDKLRHEKGIYEYNLSENEVHTCNELRQKGLVLKINDNGQTKYKVYPQKETN